MKAGFMGISFFFILERKMLNAFFFSLADRIVETRVMAFFRDYRFRCDNSNTIGTLTGPKKKGGNLRQIKQFGYSFICRTYSVQIIPRASEYVSC